jgi:hypothetical protein
MMTRQLCCSAASWFVLVAVSQSLFAGPIISFGGDEFDGNPNDVLFELRNNALFLRDSEFVVNIGPGNELAIKPLNVNLPVVQEATFDVMIGGAAVSVRGVRLTNIQIKAQKAVAGFAITSSVTKNFANPLKFGGVMLGDNTVNYAAVAKHSASIKNTGFVDGIDLGTVTQSHEVPSGAGDFGLFPQPTSTGKQIGLPKGDHKIDSKLELTKLEANAVLVLRQSGEAGVQAVPEPSSLALFGLAGAFLMLGEYAPWRKRDRYNK